MLHSNLTGRLCAALSTILLVASAQALADNVMDHVPADASIVVKFKNLQNASDQLGGLADKFGLAAANPAFKDPLAMAMQSAGINAGVDKAGDLALAVIMADDIKAPPQVVGLVPVSDYQAFLGNFADAKTDGAISSFTSPLSPAPLFAAHWGSYAAVTANKDLLATPPAGLTVQGPIAAELASRDIVMFFNMQVLGPKALKSIDQFRQPLLAAIGTNQAPGVKTLFALELSMAERFLKESAAASWGLSLSKDGIGITAMADFSADSSLGALAGALKNTDATLLAGLPDQPYMAYGGWHYDGPAVAKFIDTAVMPALDHMAKAQDKMTDEERAEQGADAKPLIETARAYQALVASSGEGTVGILTPDAPGKGAIIRIVGVYGGDPKAFVAAEHEFMTAEEGLMGTLGGQKMLTTTFTPDAKTIDDVSLARLQMKFSAPNAPGAAMVTMMYGPDGMNLYLGATDASHTALAANVDDATISQVIAAARAGKDPVGAKAPAVAVAGKLPPMRLGVGYLSLDGVATAITNYIPLVGGPAMQLNLPADLQPIGMTVATDHNALRFDTYIPVPTVQALVGAVMQAKMNMMMQQQQQQAPPPGPPAGGL